MGDKWHSFAHGNRDRCGGRDTSKRRESGLSLIEVMVALIILVLVAGGALSFVAQSTRYAAAAQDRVNASILADNLMIEALVSAGVVSEGVETFERDYGGRRWACTRTLTETGIEYLLRIDLSVADAQTGQVLANITTLKELRE